MKITYEQTSPTGTILAEIYPFEGSHASVTVTKRLDYETMKLAPKSLINWSCIGSTEVERAEQFAEALRIGIATAIALDESPEIFRERIAIDTQRAIQSQENVNG